MGARSWCDCGWRGPVRNLMSQSIHDANEHDEEAHGDEFVAKIDGEATDDDQ